MAKLIVEGPSARRNWLMRDVDQTIAAQNEAIKATEEALATTRALEYAATHAKVMALIEQNIQPSFIAETMRLAPSCVETILKESHAATHRVRPPSPARNNPPAENL
jgi:hypothetical protein